MKFMGYLPLEINFDFETTCGKKTNNFGEDRCLYPISYSVIIAFHPDLNLEKIFIARSFNHSFDQLNDVGYLSNKMLHYFDPVTAR